MKPSKLKMWKCGNEQSGKTFAEASFTGHQNEKNFVGLATDGDYIACGSEDNSLYVYYKGNDMINIVILPKPHATKDDRTLKFYFQGWNVHL